MLYAWVFQHTAAESAKVEQDLHCEGRVLVKLVNERGLHDLRLLRRGSSTDRLSRASIDGLLLFVLRLQMLIC